MDAYAVQWQQAAMCVVRQQQQQQQQETMQPSVAVVMLKGMQKVGFFGTC